MTWQTRASRTVYENRWIRDGLAVDWSIWGDGYGLYSERSVPSLPDAPSALADRWRGRQELSSLARLGAPVLRRGDGCFAYHLAVCADDLDQGIAHLRDYHGNRV